MGVLSLSLWLCTPEVTSLLRAGKLSVALFPAREHSVFSPSFEQGQTFAEEQGLHGQATRPHVALWVPFSQNVRVTETSPGLACLDTVCPGHPLGQSSGNTGSNRGWPLAGSWVTSSTATFFSESLLPLSLSQGGFLSAPLQIWKPKPRDVEVFSS